MRTADISAIPEGCVEICMGSMMTAVIYVDSWTAESGTGFYRPEGKSGNQYPYAVMMTGLLQKLPMSACDSPCV
ncbi:MAG: hypothetical protein ACLTW1_21070 [[Clostridium] innocuum]|uniref:hypothetical protein n=1 Tax=Clostridium innocuum TaxID=1522 RepID=UPI0021490830|nr:hypothetical protein [[Clostridium] innocuum]MCR0295902.1 hypothetical protein [[Clostridium] innocuum]MCR0459938.1 hypothetical protein [[Clostridium] innocuum]